MTPMVDLHRDENGRALLVGPNCDWCGRRQVLTYGCTRCKETFDVPVCYRWNWQGKGHRPIPDDEAGFMSRVVAHGDRHTPHSVLMVMSELAKLRDRP